MLNQEMHVGYVVKRYPRYSETFIVNEILEHERRGISVTIFSLRPCTDTHFQDLLARVKAPVIRIALEGAKMDDMWEAVKLRRGAVDAILDATHVEAFQAMQVAHEAESRGVTHLHAHFATSAASVAKYASRLTGIPFSFTAHAKDIFHESVEGSHLDSLLREASSAVTVSDFNLQHFRSRFPDHAGKVHRVYNGMDLERFQYHPPISRPRTILAVGRFVEKKGFDDLIKACAILAKRSVEFQCNLIGGGEEEGALRALISELGLEESVFVLGQRPQAEVVEALLNSAVLAAPCVVGSDGNRDGLPTVLLEAMALGTPCVSTDVTGIPEVIRDGDTGLLAPEREPAALAAALEKLLDDGAARVKLSAAARRLIESDFSIVANTERLRELFESKRAVAV